MEDVVQFDKPVGQDWRYRLRLAVVPALARAGRWVRIGWRKLGFGLGREVLPAQLRAAGPPEVIEPHREPLDVVCLTMMGGNHRLASVEVVLGRALAARGHRVRYVLCDQMLPVCEVKAHGEEAHWPRSCAKCYAFGLRYLRATGCEVLPVSRLIDGKRGQEPFCPTGPAGAPHKKAPDPFFPWDVYVESALLKHCRVGVLEASAEVERRRGLFVRSARVSAAVGERIARMKPDRVIMSHGIYCTWGPARDVLLRAEIPVLTYGEGKKKDTEKFNWNTSADWWDVSKEWDRVKDSPLTEAQQRRIDAYLASRRRHSQDARVYNFGDEQSSGQTRERLRLDPHKQTFVLFTNVLWDAASAQREIAFQNPVEWVMETIHWFAEHPGKQLVVKIHPAEVVIGTKQPFASLIAERFAHLPANVRVIEPQEEVNSWSILQVADLGLVHTSTVGMELPLEGVPCMVVSHTHYRGRGFTIDADSPQEYFRRIETWNGREVDRDRLRAQARKYAYLLFERYQLPFGMLAEKAVNDVRSLEPLDCAKLLADPTIRIFLRAFENQEEFLLPA